MIEGITKRLDFNALARVIDALTKCPAGLDSILGQSLRFGTAFHHAGTYGSISL